MKIILSILITFAAFNSFSEEGMDHYAWNSPAPILLNAMKQSDRWVGIGQGWEAYAGILACYESDTEGQFCLINPIDSNALDQDVIENGVRVYGTPVLLDLLYYSNSPVNSGSAEGISVKFLFARCFEPTGTGNIDDLPSCQTTTHFEETN